MPAQQKISPSPSPLQTAAPAADTAQAAGAGNAARAAQLPQAQAQGGGGAPGAAWASAATTSASPWRAAPTREQVLAGSPLERGHQGDLVSWVQAALVRLGLPVGQTGQYGPTTEGLVTEFQRVWGVGKTGKVGKDTLSTMTRAVVCSVSLQEFTAMSPGIAPETAKAYLPHLNASMLRANISSDARKAAYIAQLGHESDGFNTLEEYASGADYEGRGDLGNTQRGDGKRFKGRGPIQITGRANYRSYGSAIGVDLVKDPALAATPGVGFQLAAEYWKRNDLNRFADRGEFDTVTQRINGGQNGRADRRSRWGAAKAVLAKNANKPKVVAQPAPALAPAAQGNGPAVAPAPTGGGPAPDPGAGKAEAQGGALDSLVTGALSGDYAASAAAARAYAAAQAGGSAELRAAALELAAALDQLSAARSALEAGDRDGTRSAAHAGANGLRALRDQGHLSPNLADPAVAEAGQLWRRADQARLGSPTPSPAPGPAPAPPVEQRPADDLQTLSAAIADRRTLGLGDEGPAVAALQRALGMSGAAVTGRFGPTTAAIVQRAQREAGLVADGVVGPATLGALRGRSAANSRDRDLRALEGAVAKGALRLGDKGEGVLALQRLLGMTGSGATGTFGQTTLAVVKKHQREAGLDPDGVVGPATLRSLKGGGGGEAAGEFEAYRNGAKLGKIQIVRMDGVLLAQPMVPHWTRLKAAAARDGVQLRANSGFRTMDEQRALYQGYVNGTRGLAAAPGYSNHQHGEAIDIDVVSDAAYRWMFRNAPAMGWRNTVPSEPWHWEYFWRR
jgi:putative chitinase